MEATEKQGNEANKGQAVPSDSTLKVINLLGGPGAGKSTIALGLGFLMKLEGYNVELAREYAKKLVYEDNLKVLANQDYVFTKQLKKLRDLVGEVDYAITDSPLFLSELYNENQHDEVFFKYVEDRYAGFDNIVVWVNRPKTYQAEGRLHTLEESMKIDDMLKSMEIADLTIEATPTAHIELLAMLKERGFLN